MTDCGMEKKYKVLHVSTIDFFIRFLLADKLREIQKHGYTIETLSANTGLAEDIKKAGFVHHQLEMSRKIELCKDLKSIFQLYRFLKKNRYHIVHTHNAKAGFIGRVAAGLARVPVVVHTTHGLPFYEGQGALKNFIYRKLEQFSSWFSDGYFSQNSEDLGKIKKMVPKRVLTGYEGNGISPEKIHGYPQLNPDTLAGLRKEFGITGKPFVFLMVARFETVKNHKMLIESLKLLDRELPLKIIMAGDGPLAEEVKREVAAIGWQDKVTIVGFRKDILGILQISDAVLLTSEKEGIPRIGMEGMVMGKPMLATDVLGTRELVVDGQTGDLVPLNDYQVLAKKIAAWVSADYRPILSGYGEAAKKRILQNFTEAIVAERIDDFYQQLLKLKLN